MVGDGSCKRIEGCWRKTVHVDDVVGLSWSNFLWLFLSPVTDDALNSIVDLIVNVPSFLLLNGQIKFGTEFAEHRRF